jgi:F-type H+-transporting ATPase subunit b
MPQFDPSTFASQAFWLVVTFAFLYVLMAQIALPKIGAVLDERQRRIDDNLDKAAQLKHEAETAVAAYQKALAESRAHAQAVIKDTTDRLAAEAEHHRQELAVRMEEQVKAGESRIAAAKTTAIGDLRDVAAEVAAAVVSRLLGASESAAVAGAIAKVLEEQGQ